ncbi:class I SAM-dependent methyltransferase [Synechocystis salina]|uniref:Class I SAM-dependent methyltransferase n=1 Tax=Synechocystis salina LEGE 00031 TaxID=1828736 RepID=A0ABR9VWE3_9SYNC|nr:class I SAM-dependent methyltransferase [Synechocystis salina]MBE9242841.1 class I SAM-dependent methyltransferase [Synechocystis salina LEGE 00041]MBE9255677.1 class I SAM-dependent methyltransferase [Synechocystis salina LEGE 00031]
MQKTIQEIYFDSTRIEMLNYIQNNAKTVLDVGCANGCFSALVKERLGIEVWGIEINKDAAKIAEKKIDKVIVQDIATAVNQIPKKYFDCIVFNDVLEHLVDPYSILKKVKDNLTDQGVVVSSLPNIRHAPILYDLIINGNWDYQEWGVLDKTHLRFFTKKSIKKMFEEQGYTILKMDGINRSESFKGKFISKLLIGPVSDMQYIQFACLAKPN